MVIMDTDSIFIADRITKRRFRNGNAQYYVKWKGCPSSYNTWEPESNILDPGLILEFEARLADACLKGKRPGRKPKLLKLKVVDLKKRTHEYDDAIKMRWMERITDASMHNTNNSRDSNVESESPNESALNNNLTNQHGEQNSDKWRVPRKPKSQLLEPVTKVTNSNRISHLPHSQHQSSHFGFYPKADSPLTGSVPSPNSGQVYCELDNAKYGHDGDISSRDPFLNRDRGTTQKEGVFGRNSPISSGATNVKLGKFALLRKYRNSLEESDPVTATDVTVEGVTVTVRESDKPQGFFGPPTPKPWSVA